MLTNSEVKQINHKLYLENMGMPEDSPINDLSEDISYIIYYTDVFESDNIPIIHRHIDIEYSFGEYYEICENTDLFQFICTLCSLPLLQEEQELVLYQK